MLLHSVVVEAEDYVFPETIPMMIYTLDVDTGGRMGFKPQIDVLKLT
jgi:hypothetical protein